MIFGLLFKKATFKLLAGAGIILAFIAIIFYAHKSGMRLERLATTAKAREILLGDLKLKERLRHEILNNSDGRTAVERLRANWTRPGK